MRCPTCGTDVAAGAKFCPTCGTPLQQATPDIQTTQAVPATQAAQPAPAAQSAQAVQAPPAAQSTPVVQVTQATPSAPSKQGSSAPFVLAIIALVTSVIGLFPISFVLAIVALVMNHGQKKRGETSSKQTPTLVMALIGLILSILMAIVTAVLGGLVWLALMDDEVDLHHVTESTEPAQVAPAESPAGVWEVVSMTDGEETYDEEYLKLMEGTGISFELVLAEDGTASLEFLGESATGTWEDRGSGEVAVTFDGDTITGTISGDELTLAYDDGNMVLRRSSQEAPTTVGGPDLSGEQGEDEPQEDAPATDAPAADAAPPESEPAVEQEADPQEAGSRNAEGEPTLDDFSWYAGAGGIPEGADILTSIYDVEGTWKAYIFGEEMERLCTLRIGSDASATIDWIYVHDSSTDTGFEDSTPDSVFTGEWDGSLGLEALGPGRLALMDFWQQGERQYGMGSYMWPSGETDMVLLVRP